MTRPAAETVSELHDRADITALIHRTARAMDTRDWTLLSTCFLPDATGIFATGEVTGFPAIRSQYEAFLTPLDLTQHLIGNVEPAPAEPAPAGATSTVRSYFHAQHVRATGDGDDQFVIGGRYDDHVTRTADGWRIASRQVTGLWTHGNPAVIGATLHPTSSL